MKKGIVFITGIIAFMMFFASQGFCAPTSEQWGIIMNISGRQRMLSQKMSKEALLVIAGINPDENLKKLADSMKLFETSLLALTEGDVAMNIPACEFPDISEQLEKVSILYAELDKIFDKMVVSLLILHFLQLPPLSTSEAPVNQIFFCLI